MARKQSKKKTVPVDTIRHKDKRLNIPTRELEGFVAEDEMKPKVVLYPRDPSLDPQLVWKGKDEQDSKDLSVPVVPVYVQEKIHPQAIIEDFRRAAARAPEPEKEQLSLFADFNGIEDFEKKVDFYHHDQHWSNRMILGDSMLVMTSLAEKEGLKGKVQMIYIDPPYGIKFGSNWQVSTRKRDVKDGKAEDASRQPEQVHAYRDTWKLGIHSYLAYLRDRFVVARDLLTETGSIFVQIGDENVHLVRCVMDEIIGSENFCALISLTKTSGFATELLPLVADHILWYAKDKKRVRDKYRAIYKEKVAGEEGASKYRSCRDIYGIPFPVSGNSIDSLPEGSRLFTSGGMSSQDPSGENFQVEAYGQNFTLNANEHWKTTKPGVMRLLNAARILLEGNNLRYCRYMDDFSIFPINNIWTDVGGIQSRSDPKVYVVQTSTSIIERCILMTTDPGDLVLDPTCGSGTTAYVAEQWGRRWITMDTSRVSLALARTRLMAARYPYYLLADSPEGVAKEDSLTGRQPVEPRTDGDIRKGFVYKRVPHVTLKSIANNEEIDAIHAKWQPKQDAAREKLNKALNVKWEEWEAPRDAGDKWPKAAHEAHEEFWTLRRERQAEIDASIARRADQEILYDQPYEDNKRVRVTGPFTVESLSPHRVLSTDEDMPQSEITGRRDSAAGQFETMIIENLRKAGVQNTRKKERIVFDRLDPYAGQWLQAAGEFTDADGKSRRVAVSIGPEHGTVGPEQVKQAAKEAVKGVGFDVLVVGGFAFDPYVSEEAKQYGKLSVLTAKMNPDLAMGEELLKKTGAGNLFMVFGEPDVDIRKKDGKVVVEIKGVDVYDPTTGEIRSRTTDDIACWFIDTDYNDESFFVRHAYFTGAGEPYDKLKRALRAEIDEAAWSALYRTVSRPFAAPTTGKIAIKVINHYGDEVLKVYEL